MDRKNFIVLGSLLFGFQLYSPDQVSCRETSLAGSIGLQQEYNSNIFRLDHDEVSQWTTTALPVLTLVSTGEKDEFTLVGNSDLSWDQRRDQRDFSHGLSFSGSREISQYLQVTVSDSFSYNDDSPRTDLDPTLSITERFRRSGLYEQAEVARLLFPEIDYTPDDYLSVLTELGPRYALASPIVQREVDRLLSNTEGRRRYWDNEFSVAAEYEFARESILTLGYRYFSNDDRSSDISEYYEHSPHVSLSYRFTPQWLTSVSYEFTKGQYDSESDLSENNTLFTVGYTVSPADQLTLSYGYDNSNFQDGDLNIVGLAEGSEDIADQTGELAWNHDFSAETRLTTALLGNYLSREFNADESGFGLNAGLAKRLQRGSVTFGASTLFDRQKKDGSWDDLRETWGVDGGLTYELFENTTGTLDASYEKRYLWLLAGSKENFDDYSAGASISYSFMRWFAVTCRYTFSKLLSSNDLVPGYDEHLVMVELSASKELIRW
ncbi:MAG: outer membrane beta-barrel protein [Deltaproteobacteria bacterium]|nr:outer membrane beta-barrel protein [Deltaproteobacteria bacterium]